VNGKISFIWCFRFLASLMSRLPLRLLARGEAVAFAIQFQDVDVMSETVEQGAGEPLGSEYGRPFVERQIGGDNC
jgi:hypothetical protein